MIDTRVESAKAVHACMIRVLDLRPAKHEGEAIRLHQRNVLIIKEENEMIYQYKPVGVCSQNITVELEQDTVKSVQFVGGCNGNTQGVGALVAGMKVDEAIKRLRGIKCGFRSTSCPDQLSIALEQALKASES